MQTTVVIGEFRSLDTAKQAIQKLGEHGYMDIACRQIGPPPGESLDIMSNAYAGELPLFARGIPGSDVAVEGRTKTLLYNEEDAKKIMGEGSKVKNAYAIFVHVTEDTDPTQAEKLLKLHGADTHIKQVEVNK